MSVLSGLGETVRKRLLDDPLPFDFINVQIRIWQDSGTVNNANIVDETVAYLTPVLIASGVGIGVAFLLPCVAAFVSWDCCCGPKDKRSDGDARHTDTSHSQRVSLVRVGPQWLRLSLFVMSLLLGVVIVGLVAMLLLANQSMHSGMDVGARTAAGALGQVEDYVSDWLTGFGNATVDGSKDVYSTVEHDVLDPLPRQVSGALTNEFLGDTRELVSHIQWAGEEASTTYSNLSLVDAIATDLQGSSGKDILRKVNELSEAVATVVELCNKTLMNDPPGQSLQSPPTQKLLSVCRQVVDQSSLLVPQASTVISEVFASLPSVQLPMKQIGKVVKYDLTRAAANRSNYFSSDILQHVENDVQSSVEDALRHGQEQLHSAEEYFNDLKKSVENMLETSLGLPESKHRAEDSIDKYVVTYEQYRYDMSCLLCTAMLITAVMLLGSTAVGAWSSAKLQEMGDTERERAHFSGRLLFKTESVFLLLVSLSLVFFAVLVFIASVLGESCGPHNNFTEIIDNVIDNEDNWNGYLLSKRILQLDDFHYPLTVHQAMIDCDEAKTAWTVFHLDKKWDLDTLLNFTDTLDAHLDDVTKVEAPSVNLLGGETNTAMQNLRDAEVMSVKWQDCLNAAIAAVYAGTTGNFTRLRETMLILNNAAAEKTGSPIHADLVVALQRVVDKLRPVEMKQTDVKVEQQKLKAACEKLQDFASVQTKVNSDLQQFTDFDNRFNGQSGAGQVLRTPIQSALSKVSDLLQTHVADTKYTIQNELGLCMPLRETFNGTVHSTCDNYLSGMDQFWAIMAINAVAMVFAMFLCHHLAYFFLDQERWRQPKKFMFYKSLVYRMLATTWFLLGYTLGIIIVHRLQSDDFQKSYCCPLEAAATGITLVSVTGILIVPMHVYTFVVLVKARDASSSAVESYWVFRKHAFQFFSNLCSFFLQDIPFIVLTGIYIQAVGYADAVSVTALIVTLLRALGCISSSAGQQTGNIRRYFRWLKFRLTPGHCSASDENREQAVEESSETVPETEMASQFGIQGRYILRTADESVPSTSRPRTGSKSRSRGKEMKHWWERETAMDAAVTLSQSPRQPGRPRVKNGTHQNGNSILADQTYYELSVDQPLRNAQVNDPEPQKRMKRRLSNKQRSRQRLTEEAIVSSESEDADGIDIANRPAFRRSSRRTRSARKHTTPRPSEEYAYDATWERPLNRPGNFWSDDEVTLRRSAVSNHLQHRKAGGLSVEV